MNKAIMSAHLAYASVDPRDMRDTEFYCSEATWHTLNVDHRFSEPADFITLFGRPLRIDETVPFGTVKAVTETELDRTMRRMAAEGRVVNVMKPVAFDWSVPAPPPTPTLRALVRHWRKKLKVFARSSDS